MEGRRQFIMIIEHNMMAMNASRQFKINSKKRASVQEKLSSGYKINRAADGAAELSISEKMRRQVRGLDKTLENMQDGISLCQVADGALNEVHEILQRMNELSVQSANGTNADVDRRAIQEEIRQLKSEINRIACNTEIFGVHPLLGDFHTDNRTYELPDDTVHTLKNVEITDGRGSIHFLAEGLSFPLAGVWKNGQTKPIVMVKDGAGNSIGQANLTDNRYITYKEYPGQNKFVSEYDDGKISFRMDLTWKKVDCSTDAESKEYFEFSYDFVNTSPGEVSMDFWFQMDMLVGPASDAIPWIDGVETEHTYKWIGGSIPDDLTIDNFVDLAGNVGAKVNLSAQFKWPGISNPPDIVMSGHTTELRNLGIVMNPNVSGDLGNRAQKDYFYGIGWTNRKIAPGDSFQMQNRIGLYVEKTVSGDVYDFKGDKPVLIHAGVEAGIDLTIDLCNATTENLGIEDVSVESVEGAEDAIGKVTEAIHRVSDFRTRFGAQQNRLESGIRVNSNIMENTQDAESAIRDTDVAEMAVKNALENINAQIDQHVLSQANHQPEMALQLLK